jgi:hypothetical protein
MKSLTARNYTKWSQTEKRMNTTKKWKYKAKRGRSESSREIELKSHFELNL